MFLNKTMFKRWIDVLIWKNETSALAVSRVEISVQSLPVLSILKGMEFEEVPL